jgi:hypothetical protein
MRHETTPKRHETNPKRPGNRRAPRRGMRDEPEPSRGKGCASRPERPNQPERPRQPACMPLAKDAKRTRDRSRSHPAQADERTRARRHMPAKRTQGRSDRRPAAAAGRAGGCSVRRNKTNPRDRWFSKSCAFSRSRSVSRRPDPTWGTLRRWGRDLGSRRTSPGPERRAGSSSRPAQRENGVVIRRSRGRSRRPSIPIGMVAQRRVRLLERNRGSQKLKIVP